MRRSAVPIVLFMLILTRYGGGLAVADIVGIRA